MARPESSLAAEFVRAGHRVLEAVTLEQLVTVLRHYPNADLILIDADVKEGRERAAALGKIAIVLEPDATPSQVLRHINRLFPDKS